MASKYRNMSHNQREWAKLFDQYAENWDEYNRLKKLKGDNKLPFKVVTPNRITKQDIEELRTDVEAIQILIDTEHHTNRYAKTLDYRIKNMAREEAEKRREEREARKAKRAEEKRQKEIREYYPEKPPEGYEKMQTVDLSNSPQGLETMIGNIRQDINTANNSQVANVLNQALEEQLEGDVTGFLDRMSNAGKYALELSTKATMDSNGWNVRSTATKLVELISGSDKYNRAIEEASRTDSKQYKHKSKKTKKSRRGSEF